MANFSVSVTHESISFPSHFSVTLWAVPSGFYDSGMIPKQWKFQTSGGSSWKADRPIVKSVLTLGFVVVRACASADMNLSFQF